MEDRGITDVQSALQSQSIQSVLEKNVQGLSDGAFNSFLTNAPIPRARFKQVAVTALNSGVESTIAYGSTGIVFDNYGMFAGSSMFRFPIDGFYNITAGLSWNQPTGASTVTSWYAGLRSGISKTYALNAILNFQGGSSVLTGGVIAIYTTVSMLKPFRAGDLIYHVGEQLSGTNVNSGIIDEHSAIEICWAAPFNQYNQTGGAQ